MSTYPLAACAHLIDLAVAAGGEIMNIYAQDFLRRPKGDLTPVTEADEAAEKSSWPNSARSIRRPRSFPRKPLRPRAAFQRCRTVLSRRPARRNQGIHSSRNGEFTVNIALIEDGEPVAGVVYAPGLGRLFCGEGDRAPPRQISKPRPICATSIWRGSRRAQAFRHGPTVVASRSHRDETDRCLSESLKVRSHSVSAGSSLKFCLVWLRARPISIRAFGRTMEWDTAAGHAVLPPPAAMSSGRTANP